MHSWPLIGFGKNGIPPIDYFLDFPYTTHQFAFPVVRGGKMLNSSTSLSLEESVKQPKQTTIFDYKIADLEGLSNFIKE